MTDNKAELQTVSTDGLRTAIQDLNVGNIGVFSTLQGSGFEAQLETFAALQDAVPLNDNLGKTINLVNVIVQPVELADEESGEVKPQPRIILIDADGTSYSATSNPLFRSIQLLLGMVGKDTSRWSKPVKIHVLREGPTKRSYFVLKTGDKK